jgi:hypothetical protein
MRELDLTAGPELQAELAATLPPLLAGARWYSGRIHHAARQIIAEAASRAARGRWTACSRQSCPPCGACRT